MGTNTAQKLPPVSSDQDSSSQNSIEIIKKQAIKRIDFGFLWANRIWNKSN